MRLGGPEALYFFQSVQKARLIKYKFLGVKVKLGSEISLTHTHTHIHTYTQTHKHTNTHKHTHKHTHTNTHTDTHTDTHTHKHTHTHIYAHTHTHTVAPHTATAYNRMYTNLNLISESGVAWPMCLCPPAAASCVGGCSGAI